MAKVGPLRAILASAVGLTAAVGSALPAQADDAGPSYAAASGVAIDGVLQPKPIAGGYDYLRFDSETARTNPYARPIDSIYSNLNGRLIVVNFIDESEKGAKYSNMQTQVLTQSLAEFSSKSTAKRLALIDVVVRNEAGNPTPYFKDYMVLHSENMLGPNRTFKEGEDMPYGLVFASGLLKNGSPIAFDFALMNGVKNNADLNANAESIYVRLGLAIEGTNKIALNKSNNFEPASLNQD